MTKHLLVLFFCLFLVMIGFGITLPVFPFYAERLARAGGASQGAAAVHVGLLTGLYALMQFLLAPLWGRWSDRIGRKPLVLIIEPALVRLNDHGNDQFLRRKPAVEIRSPSTLRLEDGKGPRGRHVEFAVHSQRGQ
jgi:hypothetical protein